MARPLRLEFAGALYHVTARGNERRDIFLGDTDGDRAALLNVLGATCERFNWLIHAYCLMTNHYHLLVETPDANLSAGMRQLNGVFTQYVNRTHTRVGHLFQGRFKAILVERDSYLLELARYVVLNPVRAGMVPAPGDWFWSSYRAMVGEVPAPGWLETDAVLRVFSDERTTAVNGYRRFVAEGIGAASPRGKGSRARSTWAPISSPNACRRGSTRRARCGRFQNGNAERWPSRWPTMPIAGRTAIARWLRLTARAPTVCKALRTISASVE